MCPQPSWPHRSRERRAATGRPALPQKAPQTPQGLTATADRRPVKVPSQRNHLTRLIRRPAPVAEQVGVVSVLRLGPLRWEAWSLGLPNPRHAFTRGGALRRAQGDLDHEWRTGHVARSQRQPV
jgi:hypothetical protein